MIRKANAAGLYNAAEDLIGRNLVSGRSDRVAVIDTNGSYSYGDLNRQARQFANVLHDLGVRREQRVVLCIHDTVLFPACFLGSILAGIIHAQRKKSRSRYYHILLIFHLLEFKDS